MRLELLWLMLGLLLQSLSSMLDLLSLLLFLSGVLLKLVGQVVNLGRILTSGSVWFDLRIRGLIEIAELQLVLLRMVQQLRRPGRGWIQGTVVLLVRRWRRRVMRHLGQHPVFDLEL